MLNLFKKRTSVLNPDIKFFAKEAEKSDTCAKRHTKKIIIDNASPST